MRAVRAARRSARARRASAMDATNQRDVDRGRKASAHPYLARQMEDLGFRQNPQGSITGVRTKISPLPIHALTSLRSHRLAR